MAKSIEEMLAKRPVDRIAVDAHKKRMLEEVRACRLRDRREASDLTQVELAGCLHVSQNRVSRIEHDVPVSVSVHEQSRQQVALRLCFFVGSALPSFPPTLTAAIAQQAVAQLLHVPAVRHVQVGRSRAHYSCETRFT